MQTRSSTVLLFSALLAAGGVGVARAADNTPSSPAPATTTSPPAAGYYGHMPGSGTPPKMAPGMMGRYGAGPGAWGGRQGYGSGCGPYHPYGRNGYGMGGGGYHGYAMGRGGYHGYGMGRGGYYGYGMAGGGYHGYGPRYGSMGEMGSSMGAGMALGPIWALDLSDKQRKAIMDLMQQQQKGNWQRMARMMTDSARLQRLYGAEKWDAGAIGKVYGEIFKQRQEGIVSMIKLRNNILDLLTDAQRKQLREGYGWR